MERESDGLYRLNCFPAAKLCECCESAAALLFCRSDGLFMCMSCDSKLHGDERHERVWVCEVCEQVPAVVTCKADAAALCFACDRDIHSANPLARKHDRNPVEPFYETAEFVMMKSSASFPFFPIHESTTTSCGGDDLELDSWIPPNYGILFEKIAAAENTKSGEFLFSDSDQLMDFDDTYQQIDNSRSYPDCSVPDQIFTKPQLPAAGYDHSPDQNRYEIDFTRPEISSFNNSYTTTSSLSLTVSSSSMQLGSALESDLSYPPARNMNSIGFDGGGDFTSNPIFSMDREARVLRYREKRKNRKFQKTIRYASRKAYAETRPRIKGRFAKRNGSESDNEQGGFFRREVRRNSSPKIITALS